MGRVAVVTGGGQGIGAATVRRLAQDGYDIAVLDLQADNARRVVKGLAVGTGVYEVSVTDPDAVGQAFQDIQNTLGTIEVLVNNAGVCSEVAWNDLTVEEFRRVLDINVTGVFVCTQAAARQMIKASTAGRIVNLASINSRTVSTPGLSHYAASKGAVQMLTRATALELAPYDIRVNAVAPGIVETPLVAASLNDPSRRTHFENRIPRGSLTSVDDVAAAIAVLARPDLAAVTGVTVPVDGGEHIGGARLA